MTTEFADELQGVDVAINEEMIDRGVIADCRNCPVALGLDAVLEDGYRASINEIEFTIRGIGLGGFTTNVYSGATPEDARDFMEVFDEGEDVAPLTLRFRLPRQLLEASLRTAVLLLLLVLAGVPAWAGPLDPRAFASLGAFPTVPGSYFVTNRRGESPRLSRWGRPPHAQAPLRPPCQGFHPGSPHRSPGGLYETPGGVSGRSLAVVPEGCPRAMGLSYHI